MTTSYEYEGNLIRYDDGVVEQFRSIVVGSHRTPTAWLAVEFESRKHDMLRVQVGTAASGDAAFYSSPLNANDSFAFDVPSTEEPALRAFFDDIARKGGRQT